MAGARPVGLLPGGGPACALVPEPVRCRSGTTVATTVVEVVADFLGPSARRGRMEHEPVNRMARRSHWSEMTDQDETAEKATPAETPAPSFATKNIDPAEPDPIPSGAPNFATSD